MENNPSVADTLIRPAEIVDVAAAAAGGFEERRLRHDQANYRGAN